jgi:hypothetical protein
MNRDANNGTLQVFRALPVVALPGYSRPLVRAGDYLRLLDEATHDGRSRVR